MCNKVICVVNVTVSVSKDLKALLDQHAEINWSEVARQAWAVKARQLELLDDLTAGSKASEADVEELAKIVKKGIAEWHNEQLKNAA